MSGDAEMSKIIQLYGRLPPTADARMRFCLARREMNQAFGEWLSTCPTPGDVQVEIDDTIGVLRQLRDISRCD